MSEKLPRHPAYINLSFERVWAHGIAAKKSVRPRFSTLEELLDYVRENPVRGKLVAKIADLQLRLFSEKIEIARSGLRVDQAIYKLNKELKDGNEDSDSSFNLPR